MVKGRYMTVSQSDCILDVHPSVAGYIVDRWSAKRDSPLCAQKPTVNVLLGIS